MDKEKKKYKDGDDFYQHYDEILDKIYDQLVVNGTIDPNKYKRNFIEHYYSYDDYEYAVYDIPFQGWPRLGYPFSGLATSGPTFI